MSSESMVVEPDDSCNNVVVVWTWKFYVYCSCPNHHQRKEIIEPYLMANDVKKLQWKACPNNHSSDREDEDQLGDDTSWKVFLSRLQFFYIDATHIPDYIEDWNEKTRRCALQNSWKIFSNREFTQALLSKHSHCDSTSNPIIEFDMFGLWFQSTYSLHVHSFLNVVLWLETNGFSSSIKRIMKILSWSKLRYFLFQYKSKIYLYLINKQINIYLNDQNIKIRDE